MYNNLEKYTIDFKNKQELSKYKIADIIGGDKCHAWSLIKYNDVYRIQILVSNTKEFNCLGINDILYSGDRIDYKKKYEHIEIITFGQPSLDILLMTRAPLVYKLAHIAKDTWYVYNLELDDLIQECNLCICELYRKGYYIHKKLLATAFFRRILAKQRKKKDVRIQSIFEEIGEDITVSDIIADEKPDIEEANEINNIVEAAEFEYIKTLFTPRQLKQILFEYANHITTNETRMYVNMLKNRLSKKCINHEYFVKVVLNATNENKNKK